MEILKFPNPILFQRCEEVVDFNQELVLLLEEMYKTMKLANGIGLAANQVGLLHRMFVMEDENKKKVFLINPVIGRKSLAPALQSEGCLSAPGEFLELEERLAWVQVAYKDETGAEKKRIFSGIYSVCVQHEISHLNGESFLNSKSLSKKMRKQLAIKWNLSK